MSHLKYIVLGIVFGIMFTKAEIISWFRIYEMFRFESFHMFGIIGSAVVISAITTFMIKSQKIRDIGGNPIIFSPKAMSIPRYLFGGIIFGLGWALTGACPGPLYTLIGNGAYMATVVIIAAVFGTYLYGLLRDKLPH